MDMDETSCCPCGSQWFELRVESDEHPHGAVILDRRGVVIGYAGTPYCLECGAPWEPARSRLRSVT